MSRATVYARKIVYFKSTDSHTPVHSIVTRIHDQSEGRSIGLPSCGEMYPGWPS